MKKSIIIVIIAAILCVILCGCDRYLPGSIRTGTAFEVVIDKTYVDDVMFEFSHEYCPTVNIEYRDSRGENKTARFQLEGFDKENNIGYKNVKQTDKLLWSIARFFGNRTVPDINDFDLIQTACLKNDMPVLFMNVWQYQKDGQDMVFESREKYEADVTSMFERMEMKEWLASMG